MTPEDIQAAARETYQLAGFSPSEPAMMLDLARRILGAGCVQTVPAHALPADACLIRVHGERRIYLRSGLTQERRRFAIGHELGHHVLEVDSSSQANEDACDAFSAAIMAPDEAFRSAIREAGTVYRKLARWFVTTESCVALRFGEVTGTPLALVAPARIRVRGEKIEWPSDEAIRSLCRGSRPSVRKCRLSDDKRRLVVLGHCTFESCSTPDLQGTA